MIIYGEGETASNLKDFCGASRKDSECFGVVYGSSKDGKKKNAVLNKNIILDKHLALIILSKSGVRTPNVFTEAEIIGSKFLGLVAGRDMTHARGTDIRIYNVKKDGSWDEILEKGKARNHYVEWIDKKREFRVHVLCHPDYIKTFVYEKIPRYNDAARSEYVWNLDNGFKFVRHQGKYERQLSDISKHSIESMRYDFGAIDIIMDKDNKLYVLEVNSAPRLSERMVEEYGNYFIEMERRFKTCNHQ